MCVWCVRRVHRDIDSPPVPTSPAFPQTIQIVCCPLSPLQTACYEGVLSSKTTKKVINGGKGSHSHFSPPSLRADLKKLCNHPKLIYDSCISKKATDAFQDCMGFFEPVRAPACLHLCARP